MKILVCEDDLIILKMLELKLSREEYDVHIAHDGREAKELLNKNEYELILTDIMMPFIGGTELVNYIRTELKSDVPIIVLSGLHDEDTILKAFDLGIDDYIIKPFSPNELSIRMKRVIRRK
ncbi:MAG: response regulator transcription factor [Bacteroidetes bacterium]|jgi:DNA-binding response OmpR family regulator|nr:response regulator transcription factor [Bacteroidota bacterium]MBT5531057.1 response regulator transcription factor [Cytophagia bacterium]MBT3802663.1 response regulator transcription factor [Bacteroidota bacterium]MBT3933119.1 response regulator transcription factor [Bacteroidota bacterium]MBT4339499.1 response regulator transcription factor [Bacteroidota bacterium]